jgi:branched-chain amino acid aminotransferase
MRVWLNGKLVARKNAKLSVFDHATLYGDGVFEGIRAYGQRVFQCQAHIDRLFNSAKEIRLAIPYTKQELAAAIYETLKANSIVDGYIRLVVTRGEGTLGLDPTRCASPSVFVIADQVALYPEEMYRDGLAVIIAKTLRTSPSMLKPSIKSLNYLNNILARMEAIDAGVAEAIMLNEKGNIAECTGDNIFIVRDGQLVTPPVSAGILEGITRAVVMRLTGRLGVGLAEKDITPADLYAADECFLTGSAAEVIAVTKVDGKTIGDGAAGPITRKLLAAFRDYIRSGEEL